jgi:hypothetical protein
MDAIRALLNDMRSDDYVRFKYGKQLDAALKALDARAAVDSQVLEARLVELLELVRGKKGGATGSAATKSKRAPAKAKEAAHAHV